MAIYKLTTQKIMLPYHYLSSTGLEANHETPVTEKAVDERGNPRSENVAIDIREGRLIYEDADDYSLMTEEEKANAFYNTDKAALNRMIDFGAVELVERQAQPEPQHDEEEEDVNASEPARKEADKQGVDLSKVEGTGNNGQITLADVKKAASNK